MKMIKNNLKVLVFPRADTSKDPHQQKVYGPLKEKIKISYAFPCCSSKSISLLLLIPILFYYRIKKYKIFNIHWTKDFEPSISFLRPVNSIYFLFILVYLKLLGYKIVWTVHNILPHEKQFVNDLKARRILARLSDIKIVHFPSAPKEMQDIGLDTKNVRLIPTPGNYIKSYENKVSKIRARKSLKIGEKDFVFLSLGSIRPYKGLEELLNAFIELLSKTRRNTKLIIAGRCEDKTLLDLILDCKKKFPENIIFFKGFVEDNSLQYYFNSADIAVYSFKATSTAASPMVALSFAKPIIAPRLGCLKDIPHDVGFLYNPDIKNALRRKMEEAIKNKKKLGIMGQKALSYAKSISWEDIAEKNYEVYRSLIE